MSNRTHPASLQTKPVKSYGFFTMSANQTTNLATGDHVKFDTVQGNLSLDTGTYSQTGTTGVGRITLLAGRLYHLFGAVSVSFTQPSYPRLQWYDCTNGALLGKAGMPQVLYSSTDSSTGTVSVQHAVVPVANTVIELRLQLSYASVTAINSSMASAWIEEITSDATIQVNRFSIAQVGEEYWVDNSLMGVQIPPAGTGWIRLKSGLLTAGSYNYGMLSGESVTGTAPLVNATAVVALAASPLYGQTIHLLEDEERFQRAGQAGRLQDHAMQGHHFWTHSDSGNGAPGSVAGNYADRFRNSSGGYSDFDIGGQGATPPNGGRTSNAISDGVNGTPLIANENRPKNKGYSVFLKVR